MELTPALVRQHIVYYPNTGEVYRNLTPGNGWTRGRSLLKTSLDRRVCIGPNRYCLAKLIWFGWYGEWPDAVFFKNNNDCDYRLNNLVKNIPREKLSQSYVHKLFDYDPNTGKLYYKICRNRLKAIGEEATNLDSKGYITVNFDGTLYRAHRIIYLWWYGWLPEFIDHIDGNRTNNRIENLRVVTKSQNNCNKQMQSNNTSGYKGICWDKAKQLWYARIDKNYKCVWFEYSNDLEYLAERIKVAREFYHKEFTRHE